MRHYGRRAVPRCLTRTCRRMTGTRQPNRRPATRGSYQTHRRVIARQLLKADDGAAAFGRGSVGLMVLMTGPSVPGADHLGGEWFQDGEVSGGEFEVKCGGVLLDPLHALGTGYGDDRDAELATLGGDPRDVDGSG